MYIGDLHIHSRYSRATSKECTPEHLDLWARRKGIHIVGTGDFTHPAWREELGEKLEPAEDGLYVLRDEFRIRDGGIPDEIVPRFVVTGEISSIYKKNGRVRKVHSLILLPGLEDAQRISTRLEQIGNIHSDGRPILGLDCHDLLEIVLELCPDAVYVPAHIWTPHFSLFGAFSGFDTVEECFGDLTPYVHAVETGLSSDPPMNWRVSALDRFQLISNSDAHSPAKLGREANLFDMPLSYEGLSRAIQAGDGLKGTIEFFPEEGKYHMDGHRKCGVCFTPSDTMRYNGVCPVCGRKITVGVSHRVEELADRQEGYVRENARMFESLVPLPEVIGACMGYSPASVKVQREYQKMISELGAEFEVLRELPLEDIRKVSGGRVAEGIARLRDGRVERIPGFDGEYGVIRLFSAEELENTDGQMSFFNLLGAQGAEKKTPSMPQEKERTKREEKGQAEAEDGEAGSGVRAPFQDSAPLYGLNEQQEHAVRSIASHIAVKAGPGTGKTRTLIARLRYLMEYRKVRPGEITAVTFTNQAAAQMRAKLAEATGRKQACRALQIGTFHGICMDFLLEQGETFTLMSEAEQTALAQDVIAQTGLTVKPARFLEALSRVKSGMDMQSVCTDGAADMMDSDMADPDMADSAELQWRQAFRMYEDRKTEWNMRDFDDLLADTAEKIESGQALPGWEKRFRYLLVDEFQDIDPLQFRLVKLWNREGRELFVIGDPDQSIYGFRGADSTCFDRLRGEYGGLETISLRENYRSSPRILSAAASLLNKEPLHANRPDGEPVRLVETSSPMAEAVFIAKEISRMAGGIGMLEAHRESWERQDKKIRSFDEFAVLCRTHRQAELVEKCLRTESIPCIVAGREDYLAEETVRNSVCFFRLLENDGDVQAMKLCAGFFWDMEWSPMAEEVVRNTIGRLRAAFEKQKPQKFVAQWMEETGLVKDAAMEKLLQASVFYDTMKDFVYALCLGAESDLKRSGDERYDAGAVTVMTLHGSKGLEFPVTFIYGVRKGSVPLESEKRPADKAEERRLFYVGMTRAKEELILTSSGDRSEFISEMDERTFAQENAEKKKNAEQWEQMSLFDL